MNIGKVIKDIRTEKKISQGDLAKSCDITQTYLSQIESDTKMPSTALLMNISKELNVPLSVIFYLSIEESDVPKERRRAFKELSPTIDTLVKSVYL
ncbi:MAG TPA: helix-turn-helix transcriptional regulator [Chitinophagaceae bacterium]|nr:helix-turn-helix transcriptional regulator [Chitinophagaceae bacterium]